LEDYSKAIQINLNYSVAYFNRGNTYKTLKDYSKALDDYNKAIEIDPDYINAYLGRAFTYRYLK
jgi:tetratricopeptide (TPR) repeat protein